MILDLGRFTRKDLMVNRVRPAENWGWNKAQRVQDPRGGGRKQRPLTCLRWKMDRPIESTSVLVIPIILKALVSTASS